MTDLLINKNINVPEAVTWETVRKVLIEARYPARGVTRTVLGCQRNGLSIQDVVDMTNEELLEERDIGKVGIEYLNLAIPIAVLGYLRR